MPLSLREQREAELRLIKRYPAGTAPMLSLLTALTGQGNFADAKKYLRLMTDFVLGFETGEEWAKFAASLADKTPTIKPPAPPPAAVAPAEPVAVMVPSAPLPPAPPPPPPARPFERGDRAAIRLMKDGTLQIDNRTQGRNVTAQVAALCKLPIRDQGIVSDHLGMMTALTMFDIDITIDSAYE